MSSTEYLGALRELEVSLHKPEVRSDARRLEALLHQDFVEIGRSGRHYTRAQMLELLASEGSPEHILAQDFHCQQLGSGLALLMYRSAIVARGGDASNHAARCSIWQQTAHGWQIRFHQGTPVPPFELSSN